MSDSIELELVSSTDAPYKTVVKELYVPGYMGKTGVLEDHLPYMCLIKSGELYFKDIDDKNFYLYIREGFLEVLNNKAVLISDSLEKGEKLNKEQVTARLKEIEAVIKGSLTGETSPEDLEKALEDHKEYKTKLEIINKIENS